MYECQETARETAHKRRHVRLTSVKTSDGMSRAVIYECQDSARQADHKQCNHPLTAYVSSANNSSLWKDEGHTTVWWKEKG